MKLLFTLPEKERAIVSEETDEAVKYCTPFDLTLTNQYADGYFVITENYCLVFENGALITKKRITDGTDYKITTMATGGYLEAVFNGVTAVIMRFSMTHMIRYTYIARILETLSEREPVKIKADDYDNVCPKCGRPLNPGSRVCYFCTNKKSVLKRLGKILKPYFLSLFIALILFWLITLFGIINPYITKILINDYLTVKKADVTAIILLVGALGLSNLASTIVNIINNRILVRIGSGFSKDMRKEVYEKIQSLSLNYLDNKQVGDLMNRVTSDTNRIQTFVTTQASTGISQIITLIAVTVILFTMNWKMTLFILIPVPLIILYFQRMNETFKKMYHYQWKISDKANTILHDLLRGIKVVKVFGMENSEITRFSQISRKLADVTGQNEKKYNTIFPYLNFLMSVGQFFILYFGGILILHQQMSYGELIQFTAYTGMIYGPLGWLTFFPRSFTDAITATERIFEVIDEEPAIKDLPDAKAADISGNIRLNDVSFGYLSYEPVLKKIQLDVKQGEMIGLVGHSGSGKTTLTNLLMRLYDVDEGSITVDGKDIRNYSQTDFRRQMGVVLQETFLFSGTILQNIIYACPDAKLEDVIKASKIANAHDFIIKFPDGYDTLVGERGQRLSGGEKQRIAIARAILNNPKILILDEATASVDTETEYKIQEALAKVIQGRTTFAIAHRLSTLRNANRLLVLDKGNLIELGTHEELMRAKGKYYELVMAQRFLTRTKSS